VRKGLSFHQLHQGSLQLNLPPPGTTSPTIPSSPLTLNQRPRIRLCRNRRLKRRPNALQPPLLSNQLQLQHLNLSSRFRQDAPFAPGNHPSASDMMEAKARATFQLQFRLLDVGIG
jgi:hypothetical protein